MNNKIRTEQDARDAANVVVNTAKIEQKLEEDKYREIAETIKAASDTEILGEVDEIAAILSMPEDEFNLFAPIFIEEMERALNNSNDQLMLARCLETTGKTIEDLREEYNKLFKSLDNELKDISAAKRDFLKQMMILTLNAIEQTEGINSRNIVIPIELCNPDAKMPSYANIGDAGLDLYSPADYTIEPNETVLIKLGFKVKIPKGYALLIQPRSGKSLNTKLRIPNSPGLIDSMYHLEVGVIVENTDSKIKDITVDDEGKVTSILYGSPIYISKGERFAQMRLVRVPTVTFVESTVIEDDVRSKGFGDSGKF